MKQSKSYLETILDGVTTNIKIPKNSYLIEILHKLQNDFSYILQKMIASLAEFLNLSKAEVYGVISFYDDFKLDSKESRDNAKKQLSIFAKLKRVSLWVQLH